MSTSGQTPFLGLKLLNEDGTDFVNIPEWQIPNENATEKAIATVDNLARTYGYSLTTSTSGSTTTTTLTVSSSAPYTATRKTVETVGDSSTTYAVTVTIDDETHTMTHTVGQTTASGATTDGGGDVIPFEVMISKMNRLEASVDDTLSTTVADLEQAMEEQGQDTAALGKELHDWWVYASDTMAYTCVTPSDTSTKPYSYTETVKDSGSEVVATLVTTCNADGSYTETLTRGDVTVTRKWTKSGNTYERGAWSNG